MGVNELSAYTDNWSNLMEVAEVQEIMSLKKYQKILRSLHFQTTTNTIPTIDFIKSVYFLIKYISLLYLSQDGERTVIQLTK